VKLQRRQRKICERSRPRRRHRTVNAVQRRLKHPERRGTKRPSARSAAVTPGRAHSEGAVSLPGVTIGPRAIVGSCAVAVRHVPETPSQAATRRASSANVDEWLERKLRKNEMISWNASLVPNDADLEMAIRAVKNKYGIS